MSKKEIIFGSIFRAGLAWSETVSKIETNKYKGVHNGTPSFIK